MLTKGYLGQIKGPFNSSENVFSKINIPSGYKVKIGISINPYDLMPEPEWYFEINEKHIKMGKTGMYETDEPIAAASLYFPMGAPPSTIVDFVLYE